MFRRLLKTESGYTLIEVMVSIMILAIAIVPMAGMFDMGLSSATTSGNYDRARALANLKLEQAKSLPFDDVDPTQDLKDDFPFEASAPGTPTLYDGGKYESPAMTQAGFAGFEYIVEKQYMVAPPTDPDPADPPSDWTLDNTPTDPLALIRVTVTVQWGDGNSYTAFGLVAQ